MHACNSSLLIIDGMIIPAFLPLVLRTVPREVDTPFFLVLWASKIKVQRKACGVIFSQTFCQSQVWSFPVTARNRNWFQSWRRGGANECMKTSRPSCVFSLLSFIASTVYAPEKAAYPTPPFLSPSQVLLQRLLDACAHNLDLWYLTFSRTTKLTQYQWLRRCWYCFYSLISVEKGFLK